MIKNFSIFNKYQLTEKLVTNRDQEMEVGNYMINIFGRDSVEKCYYDKWTNSMEIVLMKPNLTVSLDFFDRKNLTKMKNDIGRILNKKLSYRCVLDAYRRVYLNFSEVYEVKKGDDVFVVCRKKSNTEFQAEGKVVSVGKSGIEVKFYKTISEITNNGIRHGNWTRNTTTQEVRDKTLVFRNGLDDFEIYPIQDEEQNFEDWHED